MITYEVNSRASYPRVVTYIVLLFIHWNTHNKSEMKVFLCLSCPKEKSPACGSVFYTTLLPLSAG